VNVLVVGAGPVGSLLGWALAAGGHDVSLVRRSRREMRSAGELVVLGPDGGRASARVTIVRDPAAAEAADLLLVAVKMYDLAEAVASCAPWPDATVLAVGNGVGAEEIVAEARAGGGLIAGSLTASAELGPTGEVHWLSRGGIGLARVRGDVEPLIDALVAAFSSHGLRARRLRHAGAMRWSKLLANLTGNAASAILDEDPAAIYADPGLFEVERRQLREALAVMRCLGHRPLALPGADVRALVLALALPAIAARPILRRVVAGARGGKSPSLRLHVAGRGGPSEVRWLNGAVVEAGAGCGIGTPVNRVLAELVDEVATDPDRRAWFRARPDRLRAAIDAAGATAPPVRSPVSRSDGGAGSAR